MRNISTPNYSSIGTAIYARRALIALAAALATFASVLWLVNLDVGPTTATAAGPWYVDPLGDDGHLCTAPGAATACATINGAIAKASAGDTINVAAGTYDVTGNPGVTVDKSLTITGAGAGTTTITGRNKNGGVVDGSSALFLISGGVINVTIQGFTIDLGDTDTDYDVGVFMPNAGGLSNIIIRNNTLLFAASGNTPGEQLIHIGGGFGVTVSGNTLDTASGNSVLYVGDGTNDLLTVSGNSVAPRGVIGGPNAAGAGDLDGGGTFFNQMGPVTNSTITGNSLTDTGIGVYLGAGASATDTITVSSNTFTSNNGHAAGFGALAITSEVDGVNTQNITVTGNTFTGSQTQPAITIVDSAVPGTPNVVGSTIAITNNFFTGNTPGAISVGAGVSGTVNATSNWWNSATGPTNAANAGGAGDALSGTGTATFSPWCGNSGCSVLYGIPDRLAFSTQPGSAATGTLLSPQPVVQAVDIGGHLGYNFGGVVTAAIGTNPGGGFLSGTTAMAATHGQAAFSNLAITGVGTGYTLVSSSAGLASATSASFNVTSPNPVPFITVLSPSAVTAGGASFTLYVFGGNFLPTSQVLWNGLARTTSYLGSTELSATIFASDIATATTASVTVFSPTPGGGLSNAVALPVVFGPTNPVPVVTLLVPSTTPAGGPDFTLRVLGGSFLPGSQVLWNGLSRTTTYVSSTELDATIVAADTAAATVGSVSVFSPVPGGGTSNAALFTVTAAEPNTASGTPSSGGVLTIPRSTGQPGVSATFQGDGTLTVTLRVYTAGQPVGSGSLSAPGGFVDVFASGATAADTLTVVLSWPPSVSSAAEAVMALRYWDGDSWERVLGQGGAAPAIDTAANTVTVVFGSTSTPPLSGLTGTVVALTAERTYSLNFRWSLVPWSGRDGVNVSDALRGRESPDNPITNDVSGQVTAVYGWNGVEQRWLAWFPTGVGIPGANDLDTLRTDTAYWMAISSLAGAKWTIQPALP